MIAALAARVADFAARNAWAVVVAGLLATLASGFYAVTHLSVDTDIEHMLPPDLGWRRDEIALDEAFLRLRLAKYGALLSCFRLLTLAFLQLSRSTPIDDLSQGRTSATSCGRRRSTRPSLRRLVPRASLDSEPISGRKRAERPA